MAKPRQQSKALKLLNEYRPNLWRKFALEACPGVNDHSLSVCLEDIQFVEKLVETLKCNIRIGVKMFWILQSTFMTDKQPGDVEEILSDITVKYECIPRRTYFRLKKQAIDRLDDYLDKIAFLELRNNTNRLYKNLNA